MQVIQAAEARALALAEGNAERLSGLLHEDFRWRAHVGETYDRAECIRRNIEGHTIWRSQQLLSPDVVIVGDTAVLYAEVTDVVHSGDDDSETFRMPMTQLWIRTGDIWPEGRSPIGFALPACLGPLLRVRTAAASRQQGSRRLTGRLASARRAR